MNVVSKAFTVLKTLGPAQALKTVLRIRNANDRMIQAGLRAKDGLEIGGPSRFFKKLGIIPVYPVINSLDGVNFSATTIWEGDLKRGQNYRWEGAKPGFQYITDGTDLSEIANGCYDFVLSCNSLEHIANPIRALKEWARVIKPGGHLLLVLPNKGNNFAQRRPTTAFSHLLDDYRNQVTEADLTHLDEILQLHDLSRDPRAGSLADFKKRSEANFDNRCLHHHVYSLDLLGELLDYINFEVLASGEIKSDIYIFGRKRTE
jgi:SAM-dependent methyltransferase